VDSSFVHVDASEICHARHSAPGALAVWRPWRHLEARTGALYDARMCIGSCCHHADELTAFARGASADTVAMA